MFIINCARYINLLNDTLKQNDKDYRGFTVLLDHYASRTVNQKQKNRNSAYQKPIIVVC